MKKYLVGLFICFILVGCSGKTKEVKSIDDYLTACSKYGLSTVNKTSRYSNDKYITASMACLIDKDELEMITYDNSESASKVQEQQIKGFQDYKSTGNIITKDKGKNYYKYTMISNRYYMISTRIDNTLIFIKTPVDNKDSIDKVLNDMGY